MKALTIKQPWASLIAHGIKDIENRSWKTNYRGRIYIHAGSDKSIGYKVLSINQSTQARIDLPNWNDLPFGAIIGEVDIIDCVKNHDSVWAEQQWQSISPVYNWVLANPVLYDQPILNVKGKLSFWEFNH